MREALYNLARPGGQRPSSADGDRPQREARRGAADLVRHANVAELVHLVLRQVLEVVELADVDALLDEQVAMHRDELARLVRRRQALEARGVRADQDRALLL